jgi:hypothetical protein
MRYGEPRLMRTSLPIMHRELEENGDCVKNGREEEGERKKERALEMRLRPPIGPSRKWDSNLPYKILPQRLRGPLSAQKAVARLLMHKASLPPRILSACFNVGR